MQCIFLAHSPFQLFNAVEARQSLQLPTDHCTLICWQGENEQTERQFVNLINPAHWKRVERIKPDTGFLMLRSGRHRLDSLLKELRPIDRFYYANTILLARHAACTSKAGEIVLLDDGTEAHLNFSRRHGNQERSFLEKSARYWMKYLVYGIKDYPLDKLTYFTIYDLPMHPQDTRIKNEYSYWRSLLLTGKSEDVVFFIGSCIVDLNIVEEASYFRWLQQVQRHFPGKQIVYFPHRRESRLRLRQYESELGFTIREINSCLEYYLVTSGILPSVFAGFYSTAFDSCQILLKGCPSSFVSFVIPSEKVREEGQKKFQNQIYSYYRRYGGDKMTLIDLE